MKFVPVLSEAQARDHAEQSQALWGAGAPLSERQDALCRRLKNAGSELFFMSGLVSDDGALAASLKRYYFPLMHRGKTSRCLGLGAIFTHPGHRRKGLAGRLIQTVLDQDKAAGCDAALLFSDIGTPYYAKLGFRGIPGATTWKSAVPERETEPPSLFLSDSTEADLPALLKLHEAAGAGLSLWLPRSPGVWRLFHEINGLTRDQLVSDSREPKRRTTKSRLKGYLAYGVNRTANRLWVADAVCEDGPALWQAVLALARQSGCSEIGGWAAPNWPKGFIADEVLEPRTAALPMVRGLELDDSDLQGAHFGSADHY